MFFIKYSAKIESDFPIRLHDSESEYALLMNLYQQETFYKFYQENKIRHIDMSNMPEEVYQIVAEYPSLKVSCYFIIDGQNLIELLNVYKEKMAHLVEEILQNPAAHNEEDPSTLGDIFVKIDYNGKEIKFSYDTPEGELLWGLSSMLPSIEKEIALQSGIVVIFLNKTSSI